MAPTKTNTQNDTKSRTTPWRNIHVHLEKTIFLCFSIDTYQTADKEASNVVRRAEFALFPRLCVLRDSDDSACDQSARQ